MAFVTQSVGTATDIQLPVGNLLVQNLVLMAVPIVLGLWLAMRRKALAERLHALLKRLAFPCLLLLVTIFFLQHRDTIVNSFAMLGGAVTVLIIAAMGSGALLSWVMRLTSRERRTIVIEVGMQNAAQAITVACSPFVFNNETIAVPAIIYALMMNIILLIYVFCLGGRRSKV
jgi:BASS family bile acid:Na+ symporter